MSEQKIPIPAMLYNASVGGHVTNSQQIIDENLNREQNDINQETVGAVPYNNTTPNGMGRIVLKKNDNFKQVVEAQTNGNTIFVIKYDFTLTGNVTVPANCILEFEGGSISDDGTHTLTGNNTGINAGLVKIFNTTITLAGTWNIAEAYPEWFGAKGDGSSLSATTNSDAIQKAINLCGIAKLTKGIYCIDKTINLPNKNTLYGISCKDTIIKGVNRNGAPAIPMIQIGETVAMDFTFIKNIHFECFAGGDWDGVQTTRPVTIENCEFYYNKTAVRANGGYCDRIILDNVFIGWCHNPNGYVVELISEMGDASYFTHTHIVENNSKGILIRKTNSTTFDTCIINGDITLERTINTLFDNLHCEGGHITINGSSCAINNGWFYKRDKSAIVIQGGNSNNYWYTSNVKLSNLDFSYNNELDGYTEIEPEIQILGASVVHIDNAFRVDNRGESGTKLRYGIETNIEDFNSISCYASIHSTIINQKVFDVSYSVDSYNSPMIYTGRGLREITESNIEDTVAMTYDIYDLFDVNRKICVYVGGFTIQPDLGHNCVTETQYDVNHPTMKLVHKYNINAGINRYAIYANNCITTRYSTDAGNHINGSLFKDASNYDFTAINRISIARLLSSGNVWCKADALPTYGVWKIGDKVLLSTDDKEYTYNGTNWVA